jgi:hypothetical protein
MLPLSEAQTATLRAAVDRIIPPDEFPAGWAGGVGGYLARQFAGDLAGLIPVYRDGLDALDATARAEWGRPFTEGTESEQDALLAQVETGARGEELARFFTLLVAHTMEGFYGDPGNGGNRGRVAWEMIGFEVRG